jgi:hypothetical protein
MDTQTDSNSKLLSIANAIACLPYAEQVRVFGSMAAGSLSPGDIDLFVDCKDVSFTDDRQLSQFSGLLRISRSNYGWVDPFIQFKNTLLVRNDQATGWVRAANARSIKTDMSAHGIPLAEIIRLYSDRHIPCD